jgi:hypothetical protein
MHIFDISSDALLHCYAVDEEENGEAIFLFGSLKNAMGTGEEGKYAPFKNSKENEMNLLKSNDNSSYR